MALSEYEQTLLEGWEAVHKKSQLTHWILLSLKVGPKHMQEIKRFIIERTNGVVEADDKSMYRALRRFTQADLITFKSAPSASGPDHKVYDLTETGQKVLAEFLKRNIINVYYSRGTRKLIDDSA